MRQFAAFARLFMATEAFYERMKRLLGDEYGEFCTALSRDARRGFRINRAKWQADSEQLLPTYEYEPLPYVEDGYLLSGSTDGIGNTPEHHAGAIYVQDPGAMATAAALDIEPDWAICDLCAAPGGKTTQLAARLHGGWLLSNEYVPKRAKILVGNVERMGLSCVTVTSMDTAALAAMYDSVFDLVVADAPCSGEGMLRKNVPAEEEWSPEAVLQCAARQAEILDNAAGMVKAGGRLLYSTCTWSLEENEMAVDAFLDRHPEYRLIPVKDGLIPYTRPGIRYSEGARAELTYTRRFYPHVAEGEGQYIALMERTDAPKARFGYKDSLGRLTQGEDAAVKALFLDTIGKIPEGRVGKYGENIVFIEHGYPLPSRGVFSAGVLIGELRGRTLVPSHQFYSVFGKEFLRRVELSTPDEADRYLAGHQIPAECENGFAAVSYLGATLGGGKVSLGVLNNHYPKGLRKNIN